MEGSGSMKPNASLRPKRRRLAVICLSFGQSVINRLLLCPHSSSIPIHFFRVYVGWSYAPLDADFLNVKLDDGRIQEAFNSGGIQLDSFHIH